jgi:CheY-like chemotaxis protein
MVRVQPLRMQFLLVLGFILLLMAAVSAAFLSLRSEEAALDVRRALEIDGQLNHIQTLATDAETGQRGYLLTGRPAYLEVFGFVKQSGGHVKIYSEVGRGTTVKVYLPRHMGELPPAAPAPVPTDLPLGRHGETILVVEDDDRVRSLSVDALRDLGYSVIHCATPDQALREIEHRPELTLLFTDIVMPEMTGRELADRALALRPGLKVLYTTAYTRNAVVHNGIVDVGTAFLAKPFTIEQLALKVRQTIGPA